MVLVDAFVVAIVLIIIVVVIVDLLLPPPKKEVMFSLWSVCLSVRRITEKVVNGF